MFSCSIAWNQTQIHKKIKIIQRKYQIKQLIHNLLQHVTHQNFIIYCMKPSSVIDNIISWFQPIHTELLIQ
jgi:hypothetical protein